jgi:hypothetical protein
MLWKASSLIRTRSLRLECPLACRFSPGVLRSHTPEDDYPYAIDAEGLQNLLYDIKTLLKGMIVFLLNLRLVGVLLM